MSWLTFSILLGLFFVTSRILVRVLLKRRKKSLVSTILHDLVAGLILIFFIFFNLNFPENSFEWWPFLGIITFVFLADWFIVS